MARSGVERAIAAASGGAARALPSAKPQRLGVRAAEMLRAGFERACWRGLPRAASEQGLLGCDVSLGRRAEGRNALRL
jgi:hypothetical protein